MAILRLDQNQIKEFQAQSEVAMDVQIGLDESKTLSLLKNEFVAFGAL